MNRYKLLLACGLSAATAFPGPAAAQQVGDWVLSQWEGSREYYPGVVVERKGDQVTVKFDDGDVGVGPVTELHPFDWDVDTSVQCRWSDGKWYPATIRWISSNGSTMQIRYDEDGTVERTNTGRCRSL